MRKNTKGAILILLLLGCIAFIIAYPYPFKMLGLLPGAEGAKVGVHSVQNPWSLNTFVVGVDNDPDASVQPTGVYNLRYDPDISYKKLPDLYVDLSKIWSEGETADKVNYWVKEGENWVHVQGEIQVRYFNIIFRAEPSGDANHPAYPLQQGDTEYEMRWSKGRVTLLTGITIWNLAYPDPDYPTKKQGRVWSCPLSARVDKIEVAVGSSKYYYLKPEPIVGRQIELYSDSSLKGSIVDIIGNKDPAEFDANATLFSAWGAQSPDTRMRAGQGYFGFEFSDFGCDWWWVMTPFPQLGYYCPKIQYTIKINYLVVGSFIYTDEEYETWVLGEAKRETPKSIWEQISQWANDIASSPFTYIWVVIALIFSVLIIIGIVAIFAPSAFFLLSRRKNH